MKQQTAVEWLVNELVKGGHIWSEPDPILENEEDWDEDFIKIIKQAKQMEKEQIINAFGVGCQVESTRLIGYHGMAE